MGSATTGNSIATTGSFFSVQALCVSLTRLLLVCTFWEKDRGLEATGDHHPSPPAATLEYMRRSPVVGSWSGGCAVTRRQTLFCTPVASAPLLHKVASTGEDGAAGAVHSAWIETRTWAW